jgi:hypothetical protein
MPLMNGYGYGLTNLQYALVPIIWMSIVVMRSRVMDTVQFEDVVVSIFHPIK